MPYLTIPAGHVTRFASSQEPIERCHEFDRDSITAVNAALSSRRPLLVRGEPGVGKSQLADAAAFELQRPLISFVVDSRTEPRDLLWRFDAVMRLAEAQIVGNLKLDSCELGDRLAIEKFVRPGPLWWALDHKSASDHVAENESPPTRVPDPGWLNNGWVVLIDEIDKAETDVPNGLLEVLGRLRFQPLGLSEPVGLGDGREPPLIVITTNEERLLPDAFVRRCMVLHLGLPQSDAELKELLCGRGQAHFGDRIAEDVLRKAADLLVEDRKTAVQNQLTPLPGQSEYLDLLRAVGNQADSAQEQLKLIDEIAKFALKKHPEMHS